MLASMMDKRELFNRLRDSERIHGRQPSVEAFDLPARPVYD
jgi:hypothetical protein